VLKRYADAVKDGNSILALIRGSAMNNDGAGASFGTPHAAAQEMVVRSALKRAGVEARDVSFIEAHGTGTAVGGRIFFRIISNHVRSTPISAEKADFVQEHEPISIYNSILL